MIYPTNMEKIKEEDKDKDVIIVVEDTLCSNCVNKHKCTRGVFFNFKPLSCMSFEEENKLTLKN